MSDTGANTAETVQSYESDNSLPQTTQTANCVPLAADASSSSLLHTHASQPARCQQQVPHRLSALFPFLSPQWLPPSLVGRPTAPRMVRAMVPPTAPPMATPTATQQSHPKQITAARRDQESDTTHTNTPHHTTSAPTNDTHLSANRTPALHHSSVHLSPSPSAVCVCIVPRVTRFAVSSASTVRSVCTAHTLPGRGGSSQ